MTIIKTLGNTEEPSCNRKGNSRIYTLRASKYVDNDDAAAANDDAVCVVVSVERLKGVAYVCVRALCCW